MTTPAKLAAFAAALAATFALSFGVGRAVGPLDVDRDTEGPPPAHQEGPDHP